MSKYRAGLAAVIGRPNVGKSTLINEFVGQKINITSHKPQTTRQKLYSVDNGENYQLVLVDTPGMHTVAKKVLNRYMNRVASNALSEVDLIIWLLEAGVWHGDDQRVLETVKMVDKPVITVVNKIDKLNDKAELLSFLTLVNKHYQADKLVPISAFNKKEVAYLREQMITYLPEQDALFADDYVTDKSQRFLVAELIREKLIRNLNKELPYGIAVEIEKFALDGKMYRIGALVIVDKSSQKAIVIGAQGAMLKKISSQARISIEGLLQAKVFLQLWVKVKNNWTDDKRSLISLGYD